MPDTQQEHREATGSQVDLIATYLDHENEVIRCAALRAFAANAPEARCRAVLRGMLTDPDPDIRSDAMERLAGLAQPEDAGALRASLEGDPVREVKIAAIAALGRLGDAGSVPLLRKLVHSRAEDAVAWEMDGDWDDWLDVQVSAIRALGALHAFEAIDDLLAAREDEFGQDIDDVVFEALCAFGPPGINVLLKIVETGSQRPVRRALAALARSEPDALFPHLDRLLLSDDPDIRRLALGVLPAGDARMLHLARRDPAPAIRQTALRAVAPARPDAVEAALQDPDQGVQAEALRLLDGKISPKQYEALVDNLLMWVRRAEPVLAKAAADALPRFAPNRSEAPLMGAIGDPDLALEVRVAAVNALAAKSPATPTAAFGEMLLNPARQVRTAALAEIASRVTDGDPIAVELLTASIAGDLDIADSGEDHDLQPSEDAAMPKGEAGPQRIRITRDGDIVEGEATAEASTLQQIIASGIPQGPQQALAEDTPEESPAKRRRRQPVEGPAGFAAQLQLDAIGVSARACDEAVEEALLQIAIHGQDDASRAAWTSLGAWPAVYRYATGVREAAAAAMREADPIRHSAAFAILAKEELSPEALQIALESEDAILRAASVAHLPAEAAVDFLGDTAQAVRLRAVGRIVQSGDPRLAVRAVDLLSSAEVTDTLAALMGESEPARLDGLGRLAGVPSQKQQLVLLEALAAQRRPASAA